jgi:hypothetical protein
MNERRPEDTGDSGGEDRGGAAIGGGGADDAIDLLAFELAHLDVDPIRAESIRARAHAELRAGRPAGKIRRALARTYRGLELPVASALALVYLIWALQTVLSVGR